VNEYNAMVAYEINEEKYYGGVDFVTPNSGEELVINVIIYYTKGDTRATKSAKWINEENGMAQIELGYTSTADLPGEESSIYFDYGFFIYQDVLSNEFELSSEYENNSKWSILERVSAEEYNGVLLDVLNEFYSVDEDKATGKEYVYVKDTRTIYWFEDKVKMKEGSTNINVIYTGYENLVDEEVLESNQEAMLFYYGDNIEKYNIATPNLKFSHIAEAFIKINKEVKGEKGNNTYYVGLFEDEASNNTDQIYKIDTVDGIGNITIELDDKEKVYYIYEVDENGNKLTDESINYNKNKVEFSSYVRDAKITTDSSVVSSVVSDYYDEEDDSKWKQDEEGNWYFETDVNGTIGAGKANYVDNVLSVKDIYQEDIMISSEEIKYKVTYVPEEGGSIEGETEESVNPGETPESVPTPKADEGYEFVRWEVEENGERVKVDPKEYIIEKDTVFYAIFEKIPVENPVDTSDIHVGVYIIISLVAIVGIVSIVYFSLKTKQQSK
ncbi:MAG: InlB B-repeat-containing protein, partial [Clostridia bacterium]|nr:InlB B-repeat-containing protein [Clostridia bacterium]